MEAGHPFPAVQAATTATELEPLWAEVRIKSESNEISLVTLLSTSLGISYIG